MKKLFIVLTGIALLCACGKVTNGNTSSERPNSVRGFGNSLGTVGG